MRVVAKLRRLFVIIILNYFFKEIIMTKSDVIQRLLEELNNQNQIYIAIIGVVLVFFGVMQWRFSDKQIKKMKDDFKKDFKIEEINDLIDEIKNTLDKSRKNEQALKKEIVEVTDMNLDNASFFLTYVADDSAKVLSNGIMNFEQAFNKSISTHNLSITTVQHVVANFSICISRMNKLGVKLDYKTNDKMEELVSIITEQAAISSKENTDSNLILAKQSLAQGIKLLKAEFKKYEDAISNGHPK